MIKAIYTWLIDLYPEEFSQTFKSEMLGIFNDRLEESHQKGVVGKGDYLIRELISLVASILRENIDSKKAKRGDILMKTRVTKLDPRIRGALVIGIGFALAQIGYFLLREAGSGMLQILANFLTRGLVAISMLEAISLAIGSYITLESESRRKLVLSVGIALLYMVGIALFYQVAMATTQVVRSDSPFVFQIVRFGTYGLMSLGIGYGFDLILNKDLKPGQITITLAIGFLSGEIFGYSLFLLYNVLLGTSPFGPWPAPAYIYMLTIQGLGEGLIIGYSLGLIQLKYLNKLPQIFQRDQLAKNGLEA